MFWRGSSRGNCIRTCRKITEKQRKWEVHKTEMQREEKEKEEEEERQKKEPKNDVTEKKKEIEEVT